MFNPSVAPDVNIILSFLVPKKSAADCKAQSLSC